MLSHSFVALSNEYTIFSYQAIVLNEINKVLIFHVYIFLY